MYFILLSYRIAHSNLYKLIKKSGAYGNRTHYTRIGSRVNRPERPKKYKNSLPIIESFVKYQQHL